MTYGKHGEADKFVAIASGSNIAITSSDGITWTETTLTDTLNWYSITYGGGKFVAIAASSNIAAYSDDGITWTETIISDTSRNWISITYGDNKFFAVAMMSTIAAYSDDGITWTETIISDTSRRWSSITYGNDEFITVASNSNIVAYSSIEYTIPQLSDRLDAVESTLSQIVNIIYPIGSLYRTVGTTTPSLGTWVEFDTDTTTSMTTYTYRRTA